MLTVGAYLDGDFTRPARRAASGIDSVGRALAEIALRRRLNSIQAVPEIHLVEVELEDLVLGVFRFDPGREDQLLELASNGLVRLEKALAGELLGNGAAALHRPTLPQVRQRG